MSVILTFEGMSKERAQKVISQSGLMSRRKAEEAIQAGRVSLNGVVFTQMGQLVDSETDVLTVDGKPVTKVLSPKTFLFYKPRGVVTTKSDELGRPTVMGYFKDFPSLNPVGRLDFESEGLLLMTEDGDLLLKLTHPRYGHQKVYETEIDGDLSATAMEQLTTSVTLEDGSGKFDAIERVGMSKVYIVTVSEGRNRFVRRMFSALGVRVVRLKRTRMGPHELGDLKPGERKELE